MLFASSLSYGTRRVHVPVPLSPCLPSRKYCTTTPSQWQVGGPPSLGFHIYHPLCLFSHAHMLICSYAHSLTYVLHHLCTTYAPSGHTLHQLHNPIATLWQSFTSQEDSHNSLICLTEWRGTIIIWINIVIIVQQPRQQRQQERQHHQLHQYRHKSILFPPSPPRHLL